MSEVLDKLNEMDGKLDKLLMWKAAHEEGHKTIDRDVNEVRETLYGNGNPGLKSQVQTLMNCKQGMSRWKDFWMGVLKVVFAALIVTVLMWFMLLYQKGGIDKEAKAVGVEMLVEKSEIDFVKEK